MSAEIWKPIPGWPGYAVSNLGRVRNKKGLVMKPTWNDGPGSHQYIRLSGQTKRYIHRLVASAFLPAPEPHRVQVAHIDGDPSNNRTTNLRWSTQKENEEDKRRHGRLLCGDKHPSAVITDQQAIGIKAATGMLNSEIATLFGVGESMVSAIRRGTHWKSVTRNTPTGVPADPVKRGEQHNMAKLTETEAREIISKRGIESAQSVAGRFGVCASTVYYIWSGKLWKHAA